MKNHHLENGNDIEKNMGCKEALFSLRSIGILELLL
jgi:hypothetical protein